MYRRHVLIFAAIALVGFLVEPAAAQFSALTCQPYEHGELREKLPTMFCHKKADALAYVDLMERRRKKEISLEQGRKELAEFKNTRDCVYVLTSHISKQTLHRATEEAPYCKELGYRATKWPSLIEAELAGDGTTIWVLTHALVPPVEK